MKQISTSLSDILQWRAINEPTQLAFRFLKDGEEEEVKITYQELDQRARSIGAALQASTDIGDRVLLLFPAGLDFIAAYFGCFYAKVIAIPLSPPHHARLEKTLGTTLTIIQDASPSAALLNATLFDAINAKKNIADQFKGIKLLLPEKYNSNHWANKWQQPIIEGNDIAFLQYTSGSTSLPKGVIVSHDNLMHNLGFIEEAFGLTKKSRTVFWLPPYHDMGLIGGILQAVFTGYPATLMPHLMFVQRPIRWLQAISRFKATTSGGPNFAYDLCLRKIKPEQRAALDLSSWEVAFNGAEPIYHKTLDQFADYFAPCGFRKKALLPCYGLAEGTLMVASGSRSRLPVTKDLVKSGIKENKAIIAPVNNEDTKKEVSCGNNTGEQNIKIVDVETLKPCLPNQVGEVWVSGRSIAKGYWNKSLESTAVFAARLPDTEDEPFLRTGDLGFINEGELFITGRLKNMIIVNGRNHYPHDIERTVVKSHPSIRPSGCAVFSIENSGVERVIVMAEVSQKQIGDASEVIKTIRKAIAENHKLPVFDIKLTLPGSIAKTTSGKIKHFLCRKNYLSGTLKEITLI